MKQKTWKAFVSLLLTGVLAISALSACGQKETNKSSEASKSSEVVKSSEEQTSTAGSESSTEVEVDPYAEKITITWLGYPGYATTEEGSYAEKLLEERFNIEIKPIFYDTKGYQQSKPLLMAGGEIPDLIYELDPANVQADAKQGFLAEVPYETIKKYAPSVVERLNETVPEVWLYSYYDGKNYGVPNIYYSGAATQVGLWRSDWLKKVGIEKVPETIDEFYEAFKKFTYEDPDGNGKNDTYGMSGDLTNFEWVTFIEIFGAYGVLPFHWMEQDGKVIYGGVTDNVKQALETLAKWYKEGLIHPDFISDNYSKCDERFLNGEVGYVNMGATSVGDFNPEKEGSRANKVKALTADGSGTIAAAVLPKGPNGDSGAFSWGMGGHVVAMGRQVQDDSAKMERILRIMEEMNNDQELAMMLTIGQEGVHYTKDPDKGMVYAEEYNTSKARKASIANTGIDGSGFFAIVPPTWETRSAYRASAQAEHYAKYIGSQNALNDYFLKPDVVPESDKYFADLRMKQLTYMAEIIRGEKPISNYDNFIAEWESQGGQILTENAQKVADIRKNIYAQIIND